MNAEVPPTKESPAPRLLPRGRVHSRGIAAALTSAFLLGTTPVFGRQAILEGFSPLAVVALRTSLATILFLGVILAFRRSLIYIYPLGLFGCLVAGWINGLGSLFYYDALGRINASVGHLLYSLYPMFLLIWLWLDQQRPTQRTVMCLLLAVSAVYLLTQSSSGKIDPLGVVEMLIAAALYALHLPINQRVLADMPAPTVTLYTLIAMSSVTLTAGFAFDARIVPFNSRALMPVLGLTLVTFLSRLALFEGVKRLGGMQTALLGLSEMFVAVALSNLFLGENFNVRQWIGAGLLMTSLWMVTGEKTLPREHRTVGWLSWLRPPGEAGEYPWQPDK